MPTAPTVSPIPAVQVAVALAPFLLTGAIFVGVAAAGLRRWLRRRARAAAWRRAVERDRARRWRS